MIDHLFELVVWSHGACVMREEFKTNNPGREVGNLVRGLDGSGFGVRGFGFYACSFSVLGLVSLAPGAFFLSASGICSRLLFDFGSPDT